MGFDLSNEESLGEYLLLIVTDLIRVCLGWRENGGEMRERFMKCINF